MDRHLPVANLNPVYPQDMHINYIGQNITSKIQLFADKCVLYKVIKFAQDEQTLKDDLAKVSNWANTWQMNFNVNKCVQPLLFQIIITITTKIFT